MKHEKQMQLLSCLEFWANMALLSLPVGGGAAEEWCRSHPLTTPDLVKIAASEGIASLQANEWTDEDAPLIWQWSQMFKKFHYGAPTPDTRERDGIAGWLERNQALAERPRVPNSIRWRMAQLLEPLGPAYRKSIELAPGKFGPGSVLERSGRPTAVAKWNMLRNATTMGWSALWSKGGIPSDIEPDGVCRLHCVPKDMFKFRTITVEELERSFLQQRVRSALLKAAAEAIPRGSAIGRQLTGDAESVQRSRCKEGARTGQLATIDLSNASDSISWADIQSVFPASIVVDLELVRASSVIVDESGNTQPLYMYAGMGNATTFIVESLYFWALFTAIRDWLTWSTKDHAPVSVFGDDIVLGQKTAAHPLFADIARECGVIVNTEKSGVSEGPGFREACGCVAYRDVTLPLLRIQGYDLRNPIEKVALCAVLNRMSASDSSLMRRLGFNMGSFCLGLDDGLCTVDQPLTAEGAYLVRPHGETRGKPASYRYNYLLQRPEWRVPTIRFLTETRSSRYLNDYEAIGVISGQLHTTGTGRCNTFQFPDVKHPVWRMEWEGFNLDPDVS